MFNGFLLTLPRLSPYTSTSHVYVEGKTMSLAHSQRRSLTKAAKQDENNL